MRSTWAGPGSASIDVTDVEPPPADLRLYDVPDIRLTPHIAGCFTGYEDAAASLFTANLRRHAAGETCTTCGPRGRLLNAAADDCPARQPLSAPAVTPFVK